MAKLKFATWIIFLTFLAGCGPRVQLNPELKDVKPNAVAVLPAQYGSGVSPDRVQQVRREVINELKNNGYTVLDEALVERVCADSDCPQRQELSARYGVEGLVELTIESAARNNFVAGYFNAIGGTLKLSTAQEQPLATVRHTETERGGLLFQSGQVIQGIISQFENSGDQAFGKLASKFAKTVVKKLPAPSPGFPGQASLDPTLKSVEVLPIEQQVYKVCASAPAGTTTSLVVNKQRTNLRDTGDGRYCGIYRLPQSAGGAAPMIAVEVRSAFGDLVREEVQISGIDTSCSLEGRLAIESSEGFNRLVANCVRLSGISKILGQCQQDVLDCSTHHLRIYKASSEIGPYRKVAEIDQATWIDRGSKADQAVFYEVLAVGKGGSLTLPVRLKSSPPVGM